MDVERSQLQGYCEEKWKVSRLRIEKYETKLKYLHPEHKLQEDRQRLADTEEKLHMLLHRKVEQYRHRFAVYMEQMKGLSPLQKLNQGYAYIEDVDKKAVRSIEQVRCGDHLSAYVTRWIHSDDSRECKGGAPWLRKKKHWMRCFRNWIN